MIDLDELHKKALEEDRKVVSVYGSFNLPGSSIPEKQPEEEYTTMREKWIRALVKPVGVTAILFVTLLAAKKWFYFDLFSSLIIKDE